jgi:hypothetical protein
VNPRIGWGQPPISWGQPHLPGWAPLVDPGPLPLRAVSSFGRWWWPTLAVGGVLAVVVYVAGHDHPGLSHRGLLTVALAALVVVLLTIHRRRGLGPLARAVTEYTVVALLATLLATSGTTHQQPANPAASTEARAEGKAGEDRPAVLRAGAKVVRAVTGAARAVAGAVRWLIDLWRQTDQQATPANSAMAAWPLSPPPTVLSTWRSP